MPAMAGEPKRSNPFAILTRNARISGLFGPPSGAKLLMDWKFGASKGGFAVLPGVPGYFAGFPYVF
jgi:hypothetical protein